MFLLMPSGPFLANVSLRKEHLSVSSFQMSEQSMMSNIFDSMSTRVLVQNQNIQEHNCDVTRELLLSDHGTYHGLQ